MNSNMKEILKKKNELMGTISELQEKKMESGGLKKLADSNLGSGGGSIQSTPSNILETADLKSVP